MRWAAWLALIGIMAAACSVPPAAAPVASANGLTEDQNATLNSLELVDNHPLYVMTYHGTYSHHSDGQVAALPKDAAVSPRQQLPSDAWACSLFAAMGDAGNRLYGRNFDWEPSPAVLLFTDPPDGFASVSMVDIKYLGFEGQAAGKIMDLSLDARKPLLDAPLLPFDGMNEKGLAVGMAAVSREAMPNNPAHASLDSLEVIREMLDHAATVDEAVAILAGHNIDMGSVPLHYLIASASGDSALVEFNDAQLIVMRNEQPWQIATNFIVSSMSGDPAGECPRYDAMRGTFSQNGGRISLQDGFGLLRRVSQDTTQWSVIYHMTTGKVDIVLDRNYSAPMHSFDLHGQGG